MYEKLEGKRTLTVWTKEKIQLHLKMPMGTAFLCPCLYQLGEARTTEMEQVFINSNWNSFSS